MRAIPSNVIDTARVPARERFALWRATLSPTHDVALPEDSNPTGFSAFARGWMLGRALVLEARSTLQIIRRSQRRIRADQTDHYIVRFQRRGYWTAETGGRTIEAGPGSVMMFDMTRATDARATDIDNINILLPRDMLDEMVSPFDMHGLVLHDAVGTLLRDHMESLVENLPHMQIEDAAGVAAATCRLVAVCLAPSRDAIERARAPLAAARLHQVRNYIDRHLSSPYLTPQNICRALEISRSTLYNVCEPMGGVSVFIRKRRLQRIHSLLTRGRERHSISEIAHSHGFVSSAHFSRVFRNAFGYSPREARAAGASGEPDKTHAHSAGEDYASWIRRIGA